MIQQAWLTATDPTPMLLFLEGCASDRKLRLFAISSFRRVPRLQGKEWERAVEVAERYADGMADDREVAQFPLVAMEWDDTVPGRFLIGQPAHAAAYSAMSWATELRRTSHLEDRFGRIQEVPVQIALLRDIFGNPFRPVTFNPEWLTSTVIALARQMYESRDFSAMPILADALQDVGCESAEILDHCRGDGPHVRGCFVVDLILGKT